MSNSLGPSNSLLTQRLLTSRAPSADEGFGGIVREVVAKDDDGDVVRSVAGFSGENSRDTSTSTSTIAVPAANPWVGYADRHRGSATRVEDGILRGGSGISPKAHAQPLALRPANHAATTLEAFPLLNSDLPDAPVDILGTAPNKYDKYGYAGRRRSSVKVQPIPKALDIQKNKFALTDSNPPEKLEAEKGKIVFNQFPPFSNDVFEASSELHGPSSPAYRFEPTLDGLEVVENWIVRDMVDLKIRAHRDMRIETAIKESEKFSFNHTLYGGGFAGHDNKMQFVQDYVNGELVYHYCKVCKDYHIPDGAPIDLQELDKCCAMLPEWWPRDLGVESKNGRHYYSHKPWQAWAVVWREYCFQDEFSNGYKDDSSREMEMPRQWDLHWHEGREWAAIGRKDGWWKCRTRKDGGSYPEAHCRLCHSSDENGDRNEPAEISGLKKGTKEYAAYQRDIIGEWINGLVEEGGKRDRAFVLRRLNEERQVKEGMTGFDF